MALTHDQLVAVTTAVMVLDGTEREVTVNYLELAQVHNDGAGHLDIDGARYRVQWDPDAGYTASREEAGDR